MAVSPFSAAPAVPASLGHRLLATLNVRQEEARAVRRLFLHHFFQGFGEALVFTVASALFLAQFAVTELPGAFLVAAVALLAVGRLYAWLEHRLPVRRLLPGVVGALVVLALLGWADVRLARPAIAAFGLIVAHRVIYLLANLEFWGVSALLLDVRQSKRLFGLISAGDVPAKLLGYLVVVAVGPVVGLPNLLLLAAVAFAASLPVLAKLLRAPALAEAGGQGHGSHSHPVPAAASTTSSLPTFPVSTAALLRIFGSPFIVGLAALSFVAVIGFTCIDFAFLEVAQQRYGYGTADRATALARFLGLLFGFGKALTIITKLFFSGRIVERLGVRRALLLPPALLLALVLGTAAAHAAGAGAEPLFLWFSALVLAAQIFKYTLHDPIFLALFQPLSRHLRLHGHTTVKGIVDPLALGAAGALLAGLIRWRGHVEPTDVSYLLLGLLLGWGGLVVVVSRQYLATLAHAIRRRFLEDGQILIGDASSAAVVAEKLTSAYPEEVIYALELVGRFGQETTSDAPASLAATLAGLLHHPAAAVRCRALEKLDSSALRTARPAVLALATDSTEVPAVRAAAVGALTRLTADADATAQVLPYLTDAAPAVRRAAITGLLRAGGLEGVVFAGQQLLRLVDAPDPADRALAADIIGELAVRSFYQPVAAFLRDPAPAVRLAAIGAAGRLANAHLLPALLVLLPDAVLGQEAARALTGFGETALPALADLLRPASAANGATPAAGAAVRVACAAVVGRIGGPRATELLTAVVVDAGPDRRLRQAALHALRATDYQAPARGPIREVLHTLLDEQLQHSAWCLFAAEALPAGSTTATGAAATTAAGFAAGSVDSAALLAVVRTALLEEVTSARERILHLLVLVAEPRTVLKIRAGLESAAREQAANALELLGHLLPLRLSAPLALLLENLPRAEKLRLLAPYVPTPATPLAPARVLARVLLAPAGTFHRWTVAVALHALPTPRTAETWTLLTPYLLHANGLLRQTAGVVARRPTPPGAAERPATVTEIADLPRPVAMSQSPNHSPTHTAAPGSGALLEIEKVVVLKSTSVFADTPEHILVDVAAIVREERVSAGQIIFQQGDFGDAMYIIYQGEVRIHAGNTTFATFRNRDLFGELALLDPEPRSAAATATTDSLLLRLDQADFYELMAERREVAQGILRMLTRRLRAQNKLLAESK